MPTPVVWVIVRNFGREFEVWKAYDNNAAAQEWLDRAREKETSANVSYEIHGLALLRNAGR